MHTSVRGIIFYNDGYILIHRRKKRDDGSIRDYYVVPGGKMEENETKEETVVREVWEEIGIKVKPVETLLEYESDYDNSIQIFMECEYISGVVGTGNGPEFNSPEYTGEYMIEIIDREKIENLNLVPEEIKDIIKEL